jgi:hypothetical protein
MDTDSINNENNIFSLYLSDVTELMQMKVLEPFVEVNFKKILPSVFYELIVFYVMKVQNSQIPKNQRVR